MGVFTLEETPAQQAETVADSPPELTTRRRGRPPKDANASIKETPISPGDSPPKPKRKRKAKPIDASLLSKQIVGLHKVAATMTGLRELEISEFEAMMLAESLAAVSREYDVTLDGKLAATIQLAAAVGVVYVPRIVMIKKRANAAKQNAPIEAEPIKTAEPITPQPSVNNGEPTAH